jgi:hypothetical protein
LNPGGGEEYLQVRIAAAEVTMGKGRVVLLGFSPQNRAQPHGTFTWGTLTSRQNILHHIT